MAAHHGSRCTVSYICSPPGCLYTTVVSGDVSLAKLCARNRSLDAG